MGGSGFSREKFNAREEFITSDVNRLQALANRDLQNLLADASADSGGTPITGFSGPCSLTGIAATYTMTLAAAQALCWNPGDAGVTADDSFYEVGRWPASILTFGAPAGNPRIDLVVETPAAVDTDSQSRTILVDPVARTTAPQSVFKTTSPLATLAVVAGTPAGSPVPPAVPAGAFALFEVYVPTGAADSTAFSVVPRMFRRAPYPWTNLSGVLGGFIPTWDLSADPAATSSAITFGALDLCRAVIDGEIIEVLGISLLSNAVFQDAGGNNPFGVAASAGWNKPYYLYAVGGRHAPQAGGANNTSPVVIVESLVPPLPTTGNPSAVITTPRGTTTQQGAVYIGLGFVAAGTTRRLACIMDDEWTHLGFVSVIGPLEGVEHVSTSSNAEAFDVNTPMQLPPFSRKALVQLTAGAGAAVLVAPDNGSGSAPSPAFFFTGSTGQLGVGASSSVRGVISLPGGGANPKIWVAAGASSVTSLLSFYAFEHRVRRING